MHTRPYARRPMHTAPHGRRHLELAYLELEVGL